MSAQGGHSWPQSPPGCVSRFRGACGDTWAQSASLTNGANHGVRDRLRRTGFSALKLQWRPVTSGHRLAQAINNYSGFDPAQAAAQAARDARVDAPLTGPKDRIATMTAGSVDPSMPLKPGNPYNAQIGYSGEVRAGRVAVPEVLSRRLPAQPPIDICPVDNCVEVPAVSRAVIAGSTIDDMVTRTVRTGTGVPFPPCDNCERWLPNQ